MYVVQQGELEVISNGEVIDRIGPGGIVGEMALVNNAPRSADVIAKIDSVVVPIDENAFMQHVHRTPFFALQVMRIVAERLRRHMSEHHSAD
jgi:CRP-like cAMP-binding protein